MLSSQLYRNTDGGRFQEVDAGPGLARSRNGRGLAVGDLDGDGAVDAVINTHRGEPTLLWNRGPRSGRWLSVQLIGRKSNRSGIGARVRVTASGRVWIREIRAGSSYSSQNAPGAHFGLGEVDVIDVLEVDWPSGRRSRMEAVAVDARVWVDEKDAEVP